MPFRNILDVESAQWRDYVVKLPAGKTGGFFGRCKPCGYTFLIGFTPMPLADFSKLAGAARCPCCGGKQIVIPQASELPCSSAT